MVDSIKIQIHGDNIVECNRAFDYIVSALATLVDLIEGPYGSITCPRYSVRLNTLALFEFQFLPGYGNGRWNQDILAYVKASGGRLREAADAIITVIRGTSEVPIAALEFCGALPAGNQAWQRQGRAFSFAHAHIPYFYIAELGGYELTSDRERKAERLPNPAIPFSFFTMTYYQGTVCLPVYEANAGANQITIDRYTPVFGKAEFLEFLKCTILNLSTAEPAQQLADKCGALVELLAASKKRKDGLTDQQWRDAYSFISSGGTLTDYLSSKAPLTWNKVAYINSLTDTARAFMAMGSRFTLGLTSSTLPLSFVPREKRKAFSVEVGKIYADLDPLFKEWIGNDDTDLAISWVMGFKPRGDDARPDRGLPPLARMLVGDKTELMTFVYGPAPLSHWRMLSSNPAQLSTANGLWEAILGVSDGLLIDSSTQPKGFTRGIQKAAWASALVEEAVTLWVKPQVRSFGEQDVDTALHVLFKSFGAEIAFEGMCNPPGGDWSGISFKWAVHSEEHRWLTLPRVSVGSFKRPDHVFALFGYADHPICLCIESKERAQSLEGNIGPRLIGYTQALFGGAPSILRVNRTQLWGIYESVWEEKPSVYISAGAYLSKAENPFSGVPDGTHLDIQIGCVFNSDGSKCDMYLRGDTPIGKALIEYLINLGSETAFARLINVDNSDIGSL